jgi:hypothetical protein
MFLPAAVFWYSLMIASNAVCGVEYATSESVVDPDPPDVPDVLLLELLPHAANATAIAVSNVSVETSLADRRCTNAS